MNDRIQFPNLYLILALLVVSAALHSHSFSRGRLAHAEPTAVTVQEPAAM